MYCNALLKSEGDRQMPDPIMSPIVHLDYLRLEHGQIQTRTLTVHGIIVINQFVCEQRLQFKLLLHALSCMYYNGNALCLLC